MANTLLQSYMKTWFRPKKDMDEIIQLTSEWKFGSVSQKKKGKLKLYKNKKTKNIIES
jgi:hypothetical protein